MSLNKRCNEEYALDKYKVELPEVDKGIDESLTRVAVCLCLDTSGSMSGERIRKLQEGLEHFKED